MIEIKGSAICDAIDSIKKRNGEEVYHNIINQLDEETKNVFENIHVATGWYPLTAFVKFLELDIKLTANGNASELIIRSEAIIEKHLNGIYKLFIKIGSPKFILSRVSLIHKSYFKGVSIELNMEGSNKAILRYTGFEKQHSLIGFSIIGFCKKALEMSGAKKVEAKYSVEIADDKGYCELIITWIE